MAYDNQEWISRKVKKLRIARNDQAYIINALRTDNNKKLRAFAMKLAEICNKSILSKGGTSQDAEDIYPKAFISLKNRVKSDANFDACLYAYFATICKHVLYDKWRKGKKEKKAEELYLKIFNNSLEDIELKELKYRIFKECIKKLNEKHQDILKMRFNGLSSKEIAAKIGTSYGCIDYTFSEIKKKLSRLVVKHPLYFLITKN